MNEEIFSGELQFKIYVFAPEQGSFKSSLGFVLLGGFAALSTPMLGDFGQGFASGLLGKPIGVWAEEVGSSVRESLEAKFVSDDSQVEFEDVISIGVLVETAERFLEADTKELLELGILPEAFPKSFVAKNKFFDALEINPQIKSISFGESPREPIRRQDFLSRVTPVRTTNESVWEYQTARYFVSSPNWDRHDKHRG